MKKITVLIVLLGILLQVNAQSNIKTIFLSTTKNRVNYEGSPFTVSDYPVYEIYSGPLLKKGHSVSEIGYPKGEFSKVNTDNKSVPFMYDRRVEEMFLSPDFLSAYNKFNNNNKLNEGIHNTINFEPPNPLISYGMAGVLVVGIDLSDYLPGTSKKAGVYYFKSIDDDKPEEIKYWLCKLEENLSSYISIYLPKALKEKLLKSNKYDKQKRMLKYDIDFIDVTGMTKKIPKEDNEVFNYKTLFSKFNKEVLALDASDHSKLQPAFDAFIKTYNFPAAYAMKAYYLLNDNPFDKVEKEADALLREAGKLLRTDRGFDFNIHFDDYYLGGVDLDINNRHEIFTYRYQFNEIFLIVALEKYCDKAAQAGFSYKDLDKNFYEGKIKNYVLELESPGLLLRLLKPGTSDFAPNAYNGPVDFWLYNEFEDYPILYQIMLDYFYFKKTLTYRKKSDEFKNSLMLSGYQHLVKKGYNVSANTVKIKQIESVYTPAKPKTSSLSLYDNFSDDSKIKWPEGTTGNEQYYKESGRYIVEYKQGERGWAVTNNFLKIQWDDLSVELTVNVLEGNSPGVGTGFLIGNITTPGISYRFVIQADGTYGFGYFKDNAVIWIVPFTASKNIVKGNNADNKLKLKIKDNKAMLYINYELVNTVSLPEPITGEQIALYSGKGQRAAFDNMRVEGFMLQ